MRAVVAFVLVVPVVLVVSVVLAAPRFSGVFPHSLPPALSRPAGRKREPTAVCGRVVEVNEFMRRKQLNLSGRQRKPLAPGN
jgi:hypothetical protein